MMSLSFNPITVGIGALCLIIIATAFLPEDAWDRFSNWFWRSDSNGTTPPRSPMPWERK